MTTKASNLNARSSFGWVRYAFIYSLFYWNISWSQNNKIDSLMLIFLNSDQVELKTFDLLVSELYPDYVEELSYAAEILQHRAVSQNNLIAGYRANDAFGMYHLKKGAHQRALNLVYKSMRYYEKQNLTHYKLKAYIQMAYIFYEWGSYQDALHWFIKALAYAEENSKEQILYKIRGDIALTYFNLNQLDKGYQYIQKNDRDYKNMDIFSQTKHKHLKGIYEQGLGEDDSFIDHLKEAKQLALQTDDYKLICISYMNLGIALFSEDVAYSKACFDSSLYYAFGSLSKKHIGWAEYNLASWFFELNQLDSALYYYQKSYTNYYSHGDVINAIDALEEMGVVYRLLKNWSEVDRLQKEIVRLKDEQYNALRNAYKEMDAIDESLMQDLARIHEKNEIIPDFWSRSIRPHILSLFLLFILLVQSLLIWVLWRKRKYSVT